MYVSEEGPPPPLRNIVEFIVKVYVPSSFDARKRSNFIEAPKVFFDIIQRLNEIEDFQLLRTAKNSLSKNSHSAHPEVILTAMVCDPSQEVRLMALDLLRNTTPGIRRYQDPVINFEARAYHEMVDFASIPYASPALLGDILFQGQLVQNLPLLPSNTEGIERLICDVKKALKLISKLENLDHIVQRRQA